MSNVVIKAENLGKKYMIGHQTENSKYIALRDVVVQNARGLWLKTRDLMQGKPIIQGDMIEEVWALRDVNFEIHQGEAVGIIGRNGAGKSTLLKILSRITDPSAGRVTINGRVASLLEVGTGFHPELSGRENIYLNGAILGMTRQEIKDKFDKIVDFSGVEKYLDTPVKRYSSGMYVRLAFAVAAHLEPEILVVDEVLAVGDYAFQKKCLGKMGDVAQEGRTVLFVSHNMAAINTLCPRAILLGDGQVIQSGPTSQVIGNYLSMGTQKSGMVEFEEDRAKTSQFKSIRVLNEQKQIADEITISEAVTIEIGYSVYEPMDGLYMTCVLLDANETVALMTDSRDVDPSLTTSLPIGTHTFCIVLPPRLLAPGAYTIRLASASQQSYIDQQESAISFQLSDISTSRGNKRVGYHGIQLPWQ